MMYRNRFAYLRTIILGYHLMSSVLSLPKEPVCSRFDYDEKVLEKMIRMEIKFEQMFEEMKQAKETMFADITRTKETMTEDMKHAREDISVTLNEFKDEMIEIKTNVSNFKDNMNFDMGNFKEKIDKESVKIAKLRDSLSVPFVAFSAYKSRGSVSASVNDIFVLSQVQLNEGDGYNSDTGIFTAPVSGFYYFAAHVCNYYGNQVHYTIVVDGTVIAASTIYDKDAHTCSSVNAVSVVNSNSRVWIKSLSSSRYYSDNYRHTSFIGVLLRTSE